MFDLAASWAKHRWRATRRLLDATLSLTSALTLGKVDAQVAGQAAQAVLDRNQSLAVMALPDKLAIAQQALGGQAGGTYLAPALYRPVLQARASPTLITLAAATSRCGPPL